VVRRSACGRSFRHCAAEGKIEAVIAELGRELGDGFMHRKPIAAAV
jgi:hypothetical protein